jgi:hypothetical protein
MPHSLRLAFVLAPIFALPVSATTWTVDDDGPAQFTTVDAAQAAAQFGDVILVAPGLYPAFHLTKSIQVLGPASGPQPQFSGTSTVAGCTLFTLAGLSLQVLQVSDVSGVGVIDDCSLAANNNAAVLKITNCERLNVSRCSITGTQTGYGGSEAAVEATDSWLQWTDNAVVGGHAYNGNAAWGQSGIALHQCLAWITSSSAVGGGGGGGGLCGSCSGNGGDALSLEWSIVRVRGSSQDVFQGGGAPFGSGSDGAGIRALPGSTLAWSGITASSVSAHIGAVVVHPVSASPAMTIAGSDGGGEHRRVLLRGPQGAPAVLAMAASSGFSGLSGFEGVLWLSPNWLLATFGLTLQGQEQPTMKSFLLPPLAGLEGVTVWFQAVYPTLPGEFATGSLLLGNAASIVLRH